MTQLFGFGTSWGEAQKIYSLEMHVRGRGPAGTQFTLLLIAPVCGERIRRRELRHLEKHYQIRDGETENL